MLGNPPAAVRSCLVILALLLLGLACRPQRQAEADLGGSSDVDPQLDPLVDPQVVSLHSSSAYTFFDGGAGSIVPEEGWGPFEKARHQTEEPVAFAWVTAREAVIRLQESPAAPADFTARCLPFTIEGAPQQTLTLRAGERVIAIRALERGWQDLRIPLPDDVLTGPGQELRLAFRYARAADETVPEAADSRRFAAAFRSLAVVPRSVRDVETFVRAATLDPRRRRLRLAVGTGAAWPLPAGSELELRLGPVTAACRRCRLEVTHRTREGEETLWQGKPASASNLALSFSTPDRALSRLRLALRATGGRSHDGRRTIEVHLPPSFLAAGRRRTAPGPGSPHVFLYLIDTLRADALTPYGAERDTSPRIADFARDAVVYDDAWSASTWTLPSVVSILTGVYPYRHRILQGKRVLSDDNVPTLAALLARSGYETFGISQSYVASDRFGIHTGFDRFVLSNHLNRPELRSQDVRRQLLRSLLERDRPGDPVFAYLHTVDPHGPYAPLGEDRRFTLEAPGRLPAEKYLGHLFTVEGYGEDPREVAHLRALYDGEVLYTDRQFGRFVRMLRHLGLYDESLIVLLSDHGEEFGEHRGFGHGRTLYEEALRVPLLIKYPRSEWAGTRIADRVSTVDLLPSILRSVGIASDGDFDGRSLRPPDLAERPAGRRLVFAEVNPVKSEHFSAVDYRAFAVDRLKCIESMSGNDQFGAEVPRWQVFDLRRDPREQEPEAADSPAAARCRSLLEGWTASRRAPGEVPASAASPEALDELRALGYIE